MHKLRLLKLLILYLLGKRPNDILRPVVCRFRITPFDVELTRTVSHAYMAFAGLGRWSWNFENIDWRGLLKEHWTPFTHSELVYYRRATKIFSRIEVTTRLIWWDEKMAYFEHRMTQGETVCAIVYSRGACFAGRERIPLDRCAKDVPTIPPMTRPNIIGIWHAVDDHVKQCLAAGAGA